MIKRMKRIATGAVLAFLVLAVPIASAATPQAIAVDTQAVTMQFDGQALSLPSGQVSFNYQSRIYIPLRFVSYALLKKVAWDAKTSTVTVSEPTAAETVSLQELLLNAAAAARASGGKSAEAGKVKVVPSNAKFVFDGVEKKLPQGQQAFNLNGTIYVPVRFMAESAGAVLNWDPATKSVTGQSQAYREAQQGSSQSGGTAGSAGTGTDGGGDSGQDPADGAGTGGAATGGSAGGAAGGGSGGSANAAFEAVKAQTLQSLKSLQDNCVNSILALWGQDDMVAKANAQLSSCDAQFESALQSAQTQMEATGADEAEIQSTLQGYRDTYNAVKEQYRALAEQFLNL